MTKLLSVAGLSRWFSGAAIPAVNAVSFDLQPDEILALIGPSGCGKTTTLRMIAGFETPDSGHLTFNGRDITDLPAERRQLGMVFQDYALFPHMSVRDNVLFGADQKTEATARHYMQMVGLEAFAARFPEELSGGQQQRVALARSLAAKPKVILLDEPFSNLDAALRQRTRLEMRRLLKDAGVGVVMVTHDQEEALSFADRVAVMHNGDILQSGPGREVYDEPANEFVASFLGRTNFIDGKADGFSCQTMLGSLPLKTSHIGDVRLSVRPEALSLDPADGQSAAGWVITAVEFRGHIQTCWVERNCIKLQIDVSTDTVFVEGDAVTVSARAVRIV